jgi:hypothetical protein
MQHVTASRDTLIEKVLGVDYLIAKLGDLATSRESLKKAHLGDAFRDVVWRFQDSSVVDTATVTAFS